MLKNVRIKLVSIMLATIFWLFIVTAHDQVKTLNYELTIEPIGLSNELTIIRLNDLPKVKLYYQATSPSVLIKSLSVNDFKATIDLSGLNRGTYLAPIQVEARHPDIEVVDFSPKDVQLVLDNKITREVLPELISLRSPANGYKVTNLRSNYNYVNIVGAESVIDTIALVQAEVELLGTESTDQVKRAKLKAYNEFNKIIDDIHTDPEFLIVDVEISPDEETKTVGIIPNLSKVGLRDGFFIKSVRIEPTFAVIRGKHTVVKDIDNLETVSLLIKELNQNYETLLDIDLPQEISMLSPYNNKVNVSIEVKSLEYQKEIDAKIVPANLLENFIFKYDRPIKLIVAGTPESLNNLDDSEIIAKIDFQSITETGMKKLNINKSDFIYPLNLDIVDYSPKLWEIEITNK
jgi:YbbR domain-containing protein